MQAPDIAASSLLQGVDGTVKIGALNILTSMHCNEKLTFCLQNYQFNSVQFSSNFIISKYNMIVTKWNDMKESKRYVVVLQSYAACHFPCRSPDRYTESGLEGNFCRNPDGEDSPWCYTTNPTTRWEYCDMDQCAGANCASLMIRTLMTSNGFQNATI